MAQKANSLSHTKWLCKYHIVFTPKYRRKIIYGQYKESIRDILRQLCAYNIKVWRYWKVTLCRIMYT